MKIAIGVRHFRPLGGAEHFMRHLAAYLAGRGHDVTVYAVSGIPMPGVHLVLLKRERWCWRCRRDWSTGRLISEALAASDADVTFGEQKVWNADVVRPGGGVEVTYWKYHLSRKYHLAWLAAALEPFCPKRRYDLMAERRSLLGPSVKTIVVNSDLVRRDMVASYPETEARIQVVHNGAFESPLSGDEAGRLRQDMQRRLGLMPSSRIALFIGHDFYRKGLESAVAALAKVMKTRPELDWHLLVTGRDHIGPYQFMASRGGVGERIHYLGDMKDAFQAYAAADVMLPTHYDPFANVTAEALCYSVPVITTRDNGGCEIIEDGVNGWVVASPDDIDGMADCLIRLSDPATLARMRLNALETSKRHKLQDTLREIERVLEKAAGIAPPSGACAATSGPASIGAAT